MPDGLMGVASTKLPKEMLEKLLRMAEEEHRPVSAMMRILLQEAMKVRINFDRPQRTKAKRGKK
jgi:hypothetical protein